MSDRNNNPAPARKLAALLSGELRRARRAHWLAALGPALALSCAALLAAALVLRLATPTTPTGGRVLAGLAWFGILLPLVVAFLWPLRRLPGVRQLLRESESRAETGQLLETATDVAEGRLAGKGYSPELMDAVLQQAATRAGQGLPAPEQGPWPRRGRRALLLLAPLALLMAFLPARGGIRPLALLATPGNPDHYAERAWLELLPGHVELLAGSPLRLELRERGLPWRFPGELTLEIDETGDLFNVADLQRTGDHWVHEREAVHQGFAYRARRGRAESPVYQVVVFHPPLLDSLRITATPPSYTGLPPRELGLHSGELRLPVGSGLALEGMASSALNSAWLRFEGESPDSLSLDVLGRELGGALVVSEDLRLSLRLEDRRGIASETPTLLGVTVLPDRAPAIEILAPGPDEDLSRDLLQTLELAATDDYGVAHLRLHAVKRGEADTLSLRLPLGESAGQPRVALRHLWDLGEQFELFPGDAVEYWLVVTDNHPSAPRRARSRVQRLRIPSIAEIYAEIEEEDAQRGDTLEEMIDEGERMQEDLRRLEEELRADPELDWEREEQLRKAFENMEQLSEQLQEMAKSLGERSEALAENEMLRDEMAEKLQSIQELMEELRDTEAGELLRRFQEMLEGMDPETLPEELAELRMDHEEIMEQLERTEALLEQLMRDQKMDALLRQVDEMLERQEELRAENEAQQEQEPGEEGDAGDESQESADEEVETSAEDSESAEGEQPESDPEAMKELAELQEKLAEEAERLQEEVEKTAEELSEEFPEQSEQMKQQEKPSEPMRDAAEQMEQNESESSESQQDASKQLLKLYWRLMQAQQGMSAQMDMEGLEALDGVTRQALELSLREEDHQAEMTRRFRAGRRAEGMRAAARTQMGLYQSMERVREELVEAAKKSFGVSREAMRTSARALEALETSVGELESGSHVLGIQAAGRSVQEVNLTVIELLHGLQMQGQGQGSGSCPSPGQSMQDMLQRQEQLNRDSRGQAQKQGRGGMSMEQRSQMQRLRAEQQAIREGLQDMMGGEEGTLGRLDRIIEEMGEIEKELEGGRISDETLRRQEKVFERMLDAQRSVHRRDFKRERQGESADELAPLLPGEFDEDDPLAKLREEIRRGQGEAAPPEYEELIQEYYRSLLERQGGATP